jgi:hypothetical protein
MTALNAPFGFTAKQHFFSARRSAVSNAPSSVDALHFSSIGIGSYSA